MIISHYLIKDMAHGVNNFLSGSVQQNDVISGERSVLILTAMKVAACTEGVCACMYT